MQWLLVFIPIVVLITVNRAHKPSPCPRVFKYEPQSDYETDRWYGKITVSSDDELEGVWLHIGLDREAQLLLNWFGESMSNDNKEFVLKNPRYILEPGPEVSIRIGVIYNSDEDIPSVERIKLNGKIVCPEKVRPNMTVFVSKPISPALAQTLDRVNMLNTNNNNESIIIPNDLSLYNRFSTDNSNEQSQLLVGINSADLISLTTQRPRPKTTMRRPTQNIQRPHIVAPPNDGGTTIRVEVHAGTGIHAGNHVTGGVEYYQGDFTLANVKRNVTKVGASAAAIAKETVQVVSGKPLFECGTVRKRGTPLILHGQRAMEGEWPWHIALYRSEGISLAYICGGSLISERHVITAAHCVTRPQTTRPSNVHGLLIYLGSTNLRIFGPGIQVVQVEKCIVHPDYNSSFLSNDLAILRLGRTVTFTDYVRPICLWSGEVKLDAVIGQLGSVVGWGFDESHNITENLQEAKMPVVASDKCIYSNPEFFSSFTSEKTFCAGFRNGTTVCNGDSGGGMVFNRGATTAGGSTIWELRGLVSVGLALQGQNVCDPSQYIVFTDVAKHLDWVKDTLAKDRTEYIDDDDETPTAQSDN